MKHLLMGFVVITANFGNLSALPPECPIFDNKDTCLQSVSENYQSQMQYLKDEGLDEEEILIDAANDVLKYETIACQKTCL